MDLRDPSTLAIDRPAKRMKPARWRHTLVGSLLAAVLVGVAPVSATAEENETNTSNPFDQSQTEELLLRSAAGESIEGVAMRPAGDTQRLHALTSDFGDYVTSITTNLGLGNVRMSGNAVAVPSPGSNQFRLTSYIVVDGTTQDGGSVNITNSSSGSLPDLYMCYPPGTVITYVVGLI